MNEFFSIGILPVVMTLFAYQAGVLCQKKFKLSLFNPILVGAVLMILALKWMGMETSQYTSGMSLISWLMTPATICLAIPMYEQFQVLRRNLKGIVIGVAAGTLSCLALIGGTALLLHFDRNLTVSLLPKSITTAIGVPLSQLLGGTASIATLSIAVTGVCGNVLGMGLCRLFKITDPIAKGVAFGTGSHVIGTAKASELDPLSGAVSSLSLVVAGLLTAVLLPALLG